MLMQRNKERPISLPHSFIFFFFNFNFTIFLLVHRQHSFATKEKKRKREREKEREIVAYLIVDDHLKNTVLELRDYKDDI